MRAEAEGPANETKNADERQALARCSQELTESGG